MDHRLPLETGFGAKVMGDNASASSSDRRDAWSSSSWTSSSRSRSLALGYAVDRTSGDLVRVRSTLGCRFTSEDWPQSRPRAVQDMGRYATIIQGFARNLGELTYLVLIIGLRLARLSGDGEQGLMGFRGEGRQWQWHMVHQKHVAQKSACRTGTMRGNLRV